MDASAESECDALTRLRERSSLSNSFQDHSPEEFHSPSRTTSPPIPHPPSPDEDASGPPSGRISLSSASTVSFKNISIKAYVTEDTIIVFRVPAQTKHAEIREKIHHKFVNEEGIPLKHDFHLAYLAPTRRRSTTSSVYSGLNKNRPGSVWNVSAHDSSLVLIQSQEEWEEILRDSDGKLTLRVFE